MNNRIVLIYLLQFLMTDIIIADDVLLRGAGASFPNEVYRQWLASFKAYRQDFINVFTSYKAVGSGTGRAWFKDGSVPLEYIGSDSLLTDKDYEDDPDLQMFPTLAGAVVLGYNLPGVYDLKLTRDIIVGIYNGTYTRWNDAAIVQVNPGSNLSSDTILAIARADKSGTTEIFTKALSSFSSKWAQKYGNFSSGLDEDYQPYYWQAGKIAYYGRSTLGVTGTLLSLRYTIGYLSVADARQAHIQYADIINKAGYVVNISSDTIQSAMDDYADSFSDRLVVDIVDGAGAASYPIAGYTYFIVRLTTMINCSSAVELWRYIDWFNYYPEARRTSESLHFVPLSEKVVTLVKKNILAKFKCKSQSVKLLAEQQKLEEFHSTQTWRTVVPITVPIVAVIFIALLIYVAIQQIKINRAVLRNEWKISLHRLKIFTEKNFSQKLSKKSLQTKDSSTRSLQAWTFGTDNVAVLDGEQQVLMTCINMSNTMTLRLRTRRSMLRMRDEVENINVLKFYGLCEREGTLYCLTMYPAKGPLCDILQDDKYKLDANFQYSMACDIASGIQYLIKHNLVHGNLSSRTCYIDEKWNVKVGDWYYNQISVLENDYRIRSKAVDESLQTDENMIARTKFWTPPEILNDPQLPPTNETDAYSFAIILVEIFSREDAFSNENSMEPKEIIKAIQTTGLRPPFPNNIHDALVPVIEKAWTRDPTQRPSMNKIKKMLEATKPSKKSVMDCMMEALEDYVVLLEDKVQERTKELEIAIQQSTDLLNRMLPPQIGKKLAAGEAVAPELYDQATLFFSDIVGFTALSSESTPMEIVSMLNDLYTTFDAVVDQHEVYKVETIGDAYMVISGAPERNGKIHAAHIASMAIGLAVASASFVIQHRPNKKLEYRAGIHSGPVCTGVVGIKMPRFCIFGDTVNTASRMESTSVSGKIQVSQNTKCILDQIGNFILEPRGQVEIKGKGVLETYWLIGKEFGSL